MGKKSNNILKEKLDGFFDDDETVIFIGAGVSMNLGLPDWKSFAYKHLDILLNNNKIKEKLNINCETHELLKSLDFRTVSSIVKHYIDSDEDVKEIFKREYKNLFKIELENFDEKDNFNNELGNLSIKDLVSDSKLYNKFKDYKDKNDRINKIKNENSLFKEIYNLNLINITTNYDDIFDIIAEETIEFTNKEQQVEKKEDKKVYYTIDDFKNLNSKDVKSGDVYHIHGSIKDIETMIISNEDYIKRYSLNNDEQKIYDKFLRNIFKNHNIIFIGYSLNEMEILKYLFEKGKSRFDKNTNNKKRLLILDAYEYEENKMNFLKKYYYENYNVNLYWYSKSENGYNEINTVVKSIRGIKDEFRRNKANLNRCSELISKNNLSYDEKRELVKKLINHHDLQISFFKKINGQYNDWYNLLKEFNYFKDKNTNIQGIVKYINSIYPYINQIDKKDLEEIYIRIMEGGEVSEE